MTPEQERYLREIASYGRLRQQVDREYPKGWYVAVLDDQVVAAADTYEVVQQALREQGRDLLRVRYVWAGMRSPDFEVFFI